MSGLKVKMCSKANTRRLPNEDSGHLRPLFERKTVLNRYIKAQYIVLNKDFVTIYGNTNAFVFCIPWANA